MSNQMWIYIAHCQKISNALMLSIGGEGVISNNILNRVVQKFGPPVCLL